MLNAIDDPVRFVAEGPSLLGPGWTAVDAFEDVDDIDEYESEEEEVWVTMDLGNAVDGRGLMGEGQYQLIGIDTPMPFLKLGNQIYQGQYTPMIGDEVILGLIRNHEDPHNPSHPPVQRTSERLTFRAVTLLPKDGEASGAGGPSSRSTAKGQASGGKSNSRMASTAPQSMMAFEEGEAGPSRIPLSVSPTKPDISLFDAAPSPVSASGSEFDLAAEDQDTDYAGSSTRGKGKRRGRGGGRGRGGAREGKRPARQKFPAVVIETPEQLQLLDVANIPASAQVTLRREALQGITIPPDLDVESRTFTRKDIDKLRAGLPLSTPRKGKSATVRRKGTGTGFMVAVEGDHSGGEAETGVWLETIATRPVVQGAQQGGQMPHDQNAPMEQSELGQAAASQEELPDDRDVDMDAT